MKDDRPIRTLMKCRGLNAALMLGAVWPEQAPQRNALAAGVAASDIPMTRSGVESWAASFFTKPIGAGDLLAAIRCWPSGRNDVFEDAPRCPPCMNGSL